MTATSTVTGELVDWTAHGDRGWGRGTVRTDTRMVRLVGVVVGARPGDAIVATGEHVVDLKYGEQFQVASATLSAPVSAEGVVAWMAAALPNIGRKRAEELCRHFGGVAALWRVVEHTPERLAEVRGVTPDRAEEIRQAWLTTAGDRDDQIQLRAWGLTDAQLYRCMRHWRTAGAAVAAIRADPYDLYRHVDGFGWRRADVVARASRVAVDAPTRIASALAYVLETHLASGHVWMAPPHFQREACNLLGLDKSAVYRGIAAGMRGGDVVKRGGRVYSAAADRAEAELVRLLRERLTP